MSRRRSGALRAALAVAAAVVLVVTAYGPTKLAEAAGFAHAQPAPTPQTPASPGYVVAPTPLHLKSTPARIIGLQALTPNQPIPMSNGAMSPPNTVYIRAKEIDLDNLTVEQDRGSYKIDINNSGSGAQAAVAGNRNATTEIWITVNNLELCVTPEVLQKAVMGYAGVFGGRLDSILKLISDTFAPFVAGPLGPVGPCLPLKALIPLLNVLISNGVPLPDTLPVANLDLEVYTVKVRGPSNLASFALPRGLLQVVQ